MKCYFKRIFAVLTAALLLASLSVAASARVDIDELIPGGSAFGVKFFTSGAVVLGTTGVETAEGLCEPAKDAGIKAGDVITKVGGAEFTNSDRFTQLVQGCGGKDISISYLRDGKEFTVSVKPARDIENGVYRIGVFIKDSTAGIGTVTFIDPETLDFGGLGHGIYDSQTGTLLPLSRGAVVKVDIKDIVKSERNSPGELHGDFGKVLQGELWSNSQEGVFGQLKSLPEGSLQPIPVADWDEIEEGSATIYTTLSGNEVREYAIEIEEIFSSSGSTKNFGIRVTDEELLSLTGGIVQGMSGSPIIQNGRLVGAVTHVLVNDPTRGYGIFIENMLNSAFDASCFCDDMAKAA